LALALTVRHQACGRLVGVYDDIRYEVDDPVAVITLNRPQAMNAWTETMDREIRDALDRAAADRKVVGIVITGEGRAFCAGADMYLLSSMTSGVDEHAITRREARPEWARDDGSDDFAGRFPYVMAIDKPVIAAINGAVAGMAFPFSLCCDIRIVSPNALFVTAFAQRGLIAEWGLSWLLPRLVGPAVALDLLYTSRRVNGEEAYRLGLANYIVEADQLMSFSREYVEQLARTSSPTSMAVMKRQVYEQLHRGLGEAEYHSQQVMLESFKRGDFKEGVRSFIEKRPPDFPRLPLDDE
jgi:enoyl-CoA hydratase/carnithine racemase